MPTTDSLAFVPMTKAKCQPITISLPSDFKACTYCCQSLILDLAALVCHQFHHSNLSAEISDDPVLRTHCQSAEASSVHRPAPLTARPPLTHFLDLSPPYCTNIPISCAATANTNGSLLELVNATNCLMIFALDSSPILTPFSFQKPSSSCA